MKREDGYYWVLMFDPWQSKDEWVILQWITGDWFQIGDRDELFDTDISRIKIINETRLMPPQQ